nr:MAG TPA: hypothetical protein [Microviridae sp.]
MHTAAGADIYEVASQARYSATLPACNAVTLRC